MTAVEAGPFEAANPNTYVRRATLARVRHFLMEPSLSVYPDLKGMCERVSDSYRDRVVLELLQNAHDAHPRDLATGRIKVVFDPGDGPFGTLSVANDGAGFTAGNVDALCSPTQTTKTVNDAIGNKGVGFLSAFQVSSHPEVFSRASSGPGPLDGYCFSFANDAAVHGFLDAEGLGDQAELVIAKMPRLYLACPLTIIPPMVEQLAAEGFATVMRLPLKGEEAKLSVLRQLADLTVGAPPVQLFLSRIAELSVTILGGASVRLVREVEVIHDADGIRLLRVACGVQTFIVAQKTVPFAAVMARIEADVLAENLPDSWLRWEGDAVVSLAVAAEGPRLAGRLYNFLPMGSDAAAPLGGHLDAPFYASIERLKLQPGVGLNAMLLETARSLALEGARLAKAHLPPAEACSPAVDFIVWTGPGAAEVRSALLQGGESLIPTLRSGERDGWSPLKAIRVWTGDDVLTAEVASRVTGLLLVDPAIGAPRTQALSTFVQGHVVVTPSDPEKADVVEGFALHLEKQRAGIARWNAFYGSLPSLFRNDGAALAGRRFLRTARGVVQAAERVDPEAPRGRGRRRKLSSVFLPPLRNAGEANSFDLPRAVQRRLDYVDPNLDLARDGAAAARRFLLAAGLVREHESREILRLMAGAMLDTGEVKDVEALRWDILTAMMRIVEGEQMGDGVVADLNILVPTREGWTQARMAYFGGRWTGTRSADLQRLFDVAAGVSGELDEHARRVLRPFGDWRGPAKDRTMWFGFLRKAGVVDTLRPLPAFAGAGPRAWPTALPRSLVLRAGLPPAQGQAWQVLMAAEPPPPNLQTDYTATGVFRLPGQVDHDALAPVAGRAYAIQAIRAVAAQPEILTMSVFRPSPQHRGNENRRTWPSPIGAFLRKAEWMPLSSGELVALARAWLPGHHGLTPPPGLPIIDFEVDSVLRQSEEATRSLRELGLAEFGRAADAWRLLEVAGDLIADGATNLAAEQVLNAARDAWQHVILQGNPPPGLKIIGRRAGVIAATALTTEPGPEVLVADGDDRQLTAASGRANPQALIFEPPASRASEIGAFLQTRFPGRVRRASEIEAAYESGGVVLAFDAGDAFVAAELGDALREVVTLSLRYRNSFYRGSSELVLQTLAGVRIRWLSDLSLRVGDISRPVPRFSERAALLPAAEGPTILAAASIKDTGRVLRAIAEALGAALGSRKLIGDPLVTFASQLGDEPLSCSYEDYAEVLEVPVEEVRGVLGASRASMAALLMTLRPFVAMAAGEAAARSFVPGAGLGSEDDVLRAMASFAADLAADPADLVRRCREAGDVAGVALALRVDLTALNRALDELGPPYERVDLTPRHQDTLTRYLDRKEPLIRESIRAHHRPIFDQAGDLTAYVADRDALRPQLPAGFGLGAIELSQSQLSDWLSAWMAGRGILMLQHLPAQRSGIEAVREANLRRLRELARVLRVAILARTSPDEPLRGTFLNVTTAEAALSTAAQKGGWADFERLDESTVLAWASRSGLWPATWPTRLQTLAITDDERALVAKADEVARVTAITRRRVVKYSGGSFTIGVDSLADLADHISTLVAGNRSLLETSTRVVPGTAPIVKPGPPGGGGGGGGFGQRPPEEERIVIGYFGEAIAFNWLKRRFGRSRIVDLSCWKSEYRSHLANEDGNDLLGYDFEIVNGKTRWFFEVKATSSEDVRNRQMIELGSTEIAHAELCKGDRRLRYRILYVLNALQPDRARLFVLPNPRSRSGKDFFAHPLSAGERLIFPLPRP